MKISHLPTVALKSGKLSGEQVTAVVVALAAIAGCVGLILWVRSQQSTISGVIPAGGAGSSESTSQLDAVKAGDIAAVTSKTLVPPEGLNIYSVAQTAGMADHLKGLGYPTDIADAKNRPTCEHALKGNEEMVDWCLKNLLKDDRAYLYASTPAIADKLLKNLTTNPNFTRALFHAIYTDNIDMFEYWTEKKGATVIREHCWYIQSDRMYAKIQPSQTHRIDNVVLCRHYVDMNPADFFEPRGSFHQERYMIERALEQIPSTFKSKYFVVLPALTTVPDRARELSKKFNIDLQSAVLPLDDNDSKSIPLPLVGLALALIHEQDVMRDFWITYAKNMLNENVFGKETPLSIAAHAGNLKAVQWLIEQGADPEKLTEAQLGAIEDPKIKKLFAL